MKKKKMEITFLSMVWYGMEWNGNFNFFLFMTIMLSLGPYSCSLKTLHSTLFTAMVLIGGLYFWHLADATTYRLDSIYFSLAPT